MILESCYPSDANVRVQVEPGDVICLNIADGKTVFSVNGDILSCQEILMLRITPNPPSEIPEWSETVKDMASHIVEAWQSGNNAGEQLHDLMRTAGIVRNKDLGHYLGVSGQTVYRWLQNQTIPFEQNILNFRQLFGV